MTQLTVTYGNGVPIAEEALPEERNETLGVLSQALVRQSELGKRIAEAKQLATAEEINAAMDLVCGDVLQYLGDWVRIGKRAVFGEGCVLSWVEECWQELTPLHAQFENFDQLAREETGEQYSTYRAKIGVYRTFIENRWGVPKIAEIGQGAFLDVPIGKLAKAVAKAKKDDLTEEQWDALLDPCINDEQFRAILFGERGGGEQEPSRITVDGDGNLRYWPNHEEVLNDVEVGVKLGYLNVRATDEDVKEQVDKIIEKAGIGRI